MKLLFVCHGNICRSPMAKMIMQDLINKAGKDASIDSCATHSDEIGEGVYNQTAKILQKHGVPVLAHRARLITKQDYESADLILIMDDENMCTLRREFGGFGDFDEKVKFLLSFSKDTNSNIVADPYYTRDFQKCYDDINSACKGLMRVLIKFNP
ncbi:Low molecular weight protein-tyrosine-phosphatase YfkJ [Campylobacter majalis]|uniref:protein-tyrosine-phosphatase n=1 Tax=Campylobacter majalis TaxID=2790656 RepID=A0ABM8QA92_9BACT|nr:low molecular weight protein-tyrosine-phosphatase [Campylobacter majalis]CAD7289781.1 Low molecular weight protein-tyrosine-phosphatase YfkJ [Campylobacter majalis]